MALVKQDIVHEVMRICDVTESEFLAETAPTEMRIAFGNLYQMVIDPGFLAVWNPTLDSLSASLFRGNIEHYQRTRQNHPSTLQPVGKEGILKYLAFPNRIAEVPSSSTPMQYNTIGMQDVREIVRADWLLISLAIRRHVLRAILPLTNEDFTLLSCTHDDPNFSDSASFDTYFQRVRQAYETLPFAIQLLSETLELLDMSESTEDRVQCMDDFLVQLHGMTRQ